jgi:N-acetylmuramoyl-L-alanine amidase
MGKTSGVKESELNLLFAEQLKKDFLSAGFRVVMTRTTSAGLYGTAHKSLKKTDMQNRRKIIENANPDIVISLHMNYYALSSRRGAQVFYNKDGVGGADFASCIQKQINGMEEAVRSCSALVGDYYILNVSPCPAVLVECGFLSNEEDEKLLVDKKYREKLSYTLFKGCVEYLSLSGAFEEKSHLSHNN